jgi:hypothetical protein
VTRNQFPSPLSTSPTTAENNNQAGLTTAPERIQRVQTRALTALPFSATIRTLFRFGSQRRRVLLWAWETLFPVAGPLPQILQTLAMTFSLYCLTTRSVLQLSDIIKKSFLIYHLQTENCLLYLFSRRMARVFQKAVQQGKTKRKFVFSNQIVIDSHKI